MYICMFVGLLVKAVSYVKTGLGCELDWAQGTVSLMGARITP